MKKLNAERNIRSELNLHSSLNHRNIIKFIETFEDKNNIYIVLEHCAKGNLFKLL
jgi:aurora kinase